MLQEETEEAAVQALASAAVAARPESEQARGQGACAAPHAGAASTCNGGCSPAACPGGLAAALPWQSRQLRRIFPSFKERHLHHGPMEVTHRDERGLLSMRALARLGLGRGSWSPPPTQQQPAQQPTQQQQQQQQPTQLQPLYGCSLAGSRGQCGPPSTVPSVQEEEGVEVENLLAEFGRSPDSEHSAERTGHHLMKSFSDLRGSSEEGCSSPVEGSSNGDAAQAAPEASMACGQQHGAAAPPQHQQQREEPQQQQCSALTYQTADVQHSPPPPQPASPPLSPRLPQLPQPSPRSPQQAQVWERRHTAGSTQEAYTQPEHAQVAALLGQPVYDSSLTSSLALVVPSTAKPHRSPFMSELLHHSHPPGPQEGQRSTGCSPAVAAAGGVEAAGAPGSAPQAGAFTGSSSSEAQWVLEDEEEEQALEWEGFAGMGSSAGSGIAAALSALPFSVRNAPLLRVIPKFYGIHQHSDGRTLLELEDLARAYRHPCIMDIKIGFRTWYPTADAKYIQRCKQKDQATTQAALGFKICGMQVYRHGAGGYWRASKRWCKTLPVELVDKALLSFAHNEHGLRPSCVYGGEGGAITQLEALEAWFSLQRDFHFYSSSVLVLYEGGAATPEDAKVRVRLVDFAHTFWQGGPASGAGQRRRDTNFLAGLRALLARLRSVVHAQLQADLT